MRPRLSFALIIHTILLLSPRARAQDATLTVYMKNGGVGSFNATGTIGTEVHVYAVSSVGALYNGSANLYAPTLGTAAPGAAFSLAIPSLTSATKVPNNKYTIQLDWPDTSHQTVSFGPVTLLPGQNSYGAGGLGSVAPIAVANMAPPMASNLQCMPDLPDPTTRLYMWWKGLAVRPEDYNLTELHVSKVAGFTPSLQTLIVQLPYGTDFRAQGGLAPSTDYYFCVRNVDRYGAVSDACSVNPCRTRDAADMVMSPPDLATPPDLIAPPDVITPPDLVAPPDLVVPVDLRLAPDLVSSPDLAVLSDLSMSSTTDLAPASDLSAPPPDLPPRPDLTNTTAGAPDMSMTSSMAADLGTDASAAADGAPMLPPTTGPGAGMTASGCVISGPARARPVGAGQVAPLLLLALLSLGRRRRES